MKSTQLIYCAIRHVFCFTKRKIAASIIILALAPMIFSATSVLADSEDNFDDNSKSTTKWGTDRISGHCLLTEKNQRLEYTCTSLLECDATRPWKLTRFPYNADWEVQIDLFNSTVPIAVDQVNSFGFSILSPHTNSHEIFMELYASALNSLPARYGFASQLETDGVTVYADSGNESDVTNGAIRIVFTSATKVFTTFYDTNIIDGYQWHQFGSFGVDGGTNGLDGNGDWGLSETDQFPLYIYGYSSLMTVSSGQMYGDNFMEIGGVTPTGGELPDPLGAFKFSYPTNNPLLTRILSLTGNYQGVSSTATPRNYNVDVAQDESGKLSILGTVDGVLNKDGLPEISQSVGAVKTVEEEPTAQLKGSFAGTLDGQTTKFSASATGPITVVDIGGGTNGFSGTASFKGSVAGVPFSGKKVMVQVPAPESVTTNIHQEWSVDLDIQRKTIKGKERTVASAQLLLPNGDTIVYPERVAKYSATKGYSLSFKRGTNITANPQRIDKKSAVTLKNMTFTKQGTEWEPAGGTITYQFLGQKGTENLLYFVAP